MPLMGVPKDRETRTYGWFLFALNLLQKDILKSSNRHIPIDRDCSIVLRGSCRVPVRGGAGEDDDAESCVICWLVSW